LSSLLPRFAPANLNPQPDIPGYSELVDKLAADDSSRIKFLKACLSELGLEVAQDDYTPPSLSSLHLTAIDNGKVTELLCDWGEAIEKEDGKEFIRAEADTFQIITQEDGLDLNELQDNLPQTESIDDPSSVIKRIIPHENKLPSDELTPRFSHERFYSSLKNYRKLESAANQWGDVLLYGDVVTSTNTLLEKCVSFFLCPYNLYTITSANTVIQKSKNQHQTTNRLHLYRHNTSRGTWPRDQRLGRAPRFSSILRNHQSSSSPRCLTPDSIHSISRSCCHCRSHPLL
jgi:hypothetical protein